MDRRRVVGLAILPALSAMISSCVGSSGVRWAESKKSPGIVVDQVGYLPHGPKFAMARLEVQSSIEARLMRGDEVLWRGTSQPRGFDEASGDFVHWIDFTSFQGSADGLQIHAGGMHSFPFSVRRDLYDELPYEALKYFYHNRSGEPIVYPFVEQTHSRPAGHLSDAHVECWLQDQCQYALDVSGGWYDAGDHGKYVVNGGISAWTLLTAYERMLHLSETTTSWGDNTLSIPESGNGVPDLLDEARVEVEFLLKMQVPAGQPLEGMVHHKVHDNAWTPLAIEPAPHTDQRGLHPPSTAATLNMAAVAAQAARIFRDFDPNFAKRCLLGATTAFEAARRTPDKFAPKLDNQGGGPYDDTYVLDEFFWAAAELFITTRQERYLTELEASPHFVQFPVRLARPGGPADGDGVTAAMSWQSTAALGWISLSVVPNGLEPKERERLRRGLVEAGDTFLEAIQREGYRIPMNLGESKKYPWGSNSVILNNMVVLALAHDLSGATQYADGVIEGMNYLLGRNPLLQSYITGYGSVPLEHPHHRFWANSLNSSYPKPPRGVVSGGPNSSLQDPQTKKSGLSRSLPPQKCFVDHIDAWSVNEVTINWNAPLAFVAIFLKEYAHHFPERG